MRNIDKKYHYLYKTTNLINEKYYYGMHSTNNIEDRYLGSGIYLRRAIRKYGKDNFKREIIQMFDTREELVNAEQEIITEQVLKDKQNMNCQYGGEGFNTIGMVTVKDQNGNTMKVFCNDPRYLSGELKHITINTIVVKNKEGKIFMINNKDHRYLSGELQHISKYKVTLKDKDNNYYQVEKTDPRYLSGELVGITKDKILVKDKNNKTFFVEKNDPRYLSGELVGNWTNKNHTHETKKKISDSKKGTCLGNKNSQFGTCWITKDNVNKKIKKEELDQYLNIGWNKGRI